MNATTHTTHSRVVVPAALLGLAALLLAPVPSDADEFGLFDGKVSGVWKTTLTLGSGFRARDAQPDLVGAGAGQGDNPVFPGASGAVGVNDDAELNFPNAGDLVSAPLSFTSELSLTHRSGQGVFVRARAWYDLGTLGRNVPHGNVGGLYAPDSRLVDAGFKGAAKFAGIDIYDAFFFGSYRVGGARFLVRAGRQAVDWGTGIFYPGINAFNAMDAAWATLPGARIANGGRLPVNRIFTSFQGPAGMSVEGFVNLEFRPYVMPGCGTYFSGLDPGGGNPGCNSPTSAGLDDRTSLLLKTRNYYLGTLFAGGLFPDGETDTRLGSRPMTGEPSRWSGYGVSVRKFVEPLDTELGFFYTGYTSPVFVQAAVSGATPLEFSINTLYPTGVKAWAVSAETGRQNVTMSAQFTRTLDFPAHYNAPGYIIGTNTGTGPFGFMKSECIERECQTHFPTNTSQLQFGGTWQFGRTFGMSNATLTAEADMQWATNLPPRDGPGAIRIGRYGNFGDADWTNDEGFVCNPGPLDNGIGNKCAIEGFGTPFAMGYKVRLQNTFPNALLGLTLTPVVTLGHDVTGFTVDQFTVVGGRVSLGAFLRADTPKQKYFFELGALLYRSGAEWDPMRDRGHYTVVLGYNIR